MELLQMIIVFMVGLTIIKIFGNNILNKLSSLFNASFIGLIMKKVSFVLGNIDNISLTVVFFTICIIGIVLFDVKIKNVAKDKKIEKHSVSIVEGNKGQIRENFTENISETDKKHITGGLNIDLEADFSSPGFEEFYNEKFNSSDIESGKVIQNYDNGNVTDKQYTLI